MTASAPSTPTAENPVADLTHGETLERPTELKAAPPDSEQREQKHIIATEGELISDSVKRGKKKTRKERVPRSLLPLSNSALQPRVQQIEVCKAIAQEVYKYRKQIDEVEEHVYQCERSNGDLKKDEVEESKKQDEINLFLGEKEALDLLHTEGRSTP